MEKEVTIRLEQIIRQTELVLHQILALKDKILRGGYYVSYRQYLDLQEKYQHLKNMIDNFENGELSLRRPLWESDNTSNMNKNRKVLHDDKLAYEDIT